MERGREYSKNKILTIPNILSFFRIGLIPLIVWQYVFRENYVVSLYLLALSGLTDVADGIIARTFHMVSDFGKALDPVADKLTQITILVCLAIRFPLIWIPLILLVIKEIAAGIVGLKMVRRGIVLGADWHGKVTTVLLYATMLIHLPWINIPSALSSGLIAACTVMILLSGILYAIRNGRALRAGEEC